MGKRMGMGLPGRSPDKARDALFDCTTVTCGSWFADM
jgi:hypothetical protein